MNNLQRLCTIRKQMKFKHGDAVSLINDPTVKGTIFNIILNETKPTYYAKEHNGNTIICGNDDTLNAEPSINNRIFKNVKF